MTAFGWVAIAIVAMGMGCVPVEAAHEPTHAEREAAREGPKVTALAEPEPPWVAQGRANAKRHFEEVAKAERQRVADHTANCASDRDVRRAQIIEAHRVDVADAEEYQRLTRYAKAHCRRVTKPNFEDQRVVDQYGYVRVVPILIGHSEEWSCPKGAPPGIDGNEEVIRPSHGHYNEIAVRKNEECRDVDGDALDGGAP